MDMDADLMVSTPAHIHTWY